MKRPCRKPCAAGRALTLIALAALSSVCLGAPQDRNQPIYLEADRVEMDDVKGISVYTGAVKVSQGTMLLRGDKVVVYTQNREPARYVASGAPAHFEQQPKAQQAAIVATARELDYNVKTETLELRGGARLTQGRDSFEGERMSYDSARSLVTAAGGSGGRIRMVIQPDSLKSGGGAGKSGGT